MKINLLMLLSKKNLKQEIKEEVKEVPKKIKTANFIKHNTFQATTFQEVYSCIDFVYNNFNIDNMHELLTTKQEEIISYIEKKIQ
jgi:hypothetical protein